jgi:AcrR family transcriptional regulator
MSERIKIASAPQGGATTMAVSKGERTRQRIMDAAEPLFARHGVDGVSLRQISTAAGLTEPALYNHYAGKRALYAAVLERALRPMSAALDEVLATGTSPDSLPGRMTDLLHQHPHMAALFQQALQGEPDSEGQQVMRQWLEHLVRQGARSMRTALGEQTQDPASVAIGVIAMFNLTTGYFQAQALFSALAEGDILAAENIQRQKRFVSKLFRMLLIALE